MGSIGATMDFTESPLCCSHYARGCSPHLRKSSQYRVTNYIQGSKGEHRINEKIQGNMDLKDRCRSRRTVMHTAETSNATAVPDALVNTESRLGTSIQLSC